MRSQTDLENADSLGEASERRGSERATALFRPALLEKEGFQSFCLVRNISSTGLMATVLAPPSENSEMSIRFDECTRMSGIVAWQEGDKLGIKFDDPIEVEELLTRLGERKASEKGYRSPRLPIDTSAQFLTQGEVFRLRVQDVSQRGIKTTIDSSFVAEGSVGTVVLSGLHPRQAVVRWASDGKAGFYFLDPIAFSELGQWVLDHHRRVTSKQHGGVEAA